MSATITYYTTARRVVERYTPSNQVGRETFHAAIHAFDRGYPIDYCRHKHRTEKAALACGNRIIRKLSKALPA